MPTDYLISLDEFCTGHKIEFSFISTLQQSGLIEVSTINEIDFIDVAQLPQLEKLIRLYYELDINLEGIETIVHLLQRINALHDEIAMLRNKLRFYESIGT